MSFYLTDRISSKGIRPWKAGCFVPGFTLVEILVAISVFAVLVSLVLGSLSFVLSRTSAVKESIKIYEEARICLDRISTDLRAVYVPVSPGYEPPGFGDDPDPYRFFCETSRMEGSDLEFTAFSHLPLGGGIPSRAGNIIYYLRETEDDGRVLMRRDAAFINDESAEPFADIGHDGMDPILCRNIKKFNIVCVGEDGVEHDSWDSDSSDVSYATPVAVRVSIVAGGLHGEYQFDTMISLPVFREKVADEL